MKQIFPSILIVAVSVVISVGIVKSTPASTPPVTFGNFNPTAGQTYRLQSSVTSSGTSLTLTSFKEPVSNIKYTMSYLNSSIEYATIEPQSTSKELISFTGITQNGDGTATLTGLTRGLGFSYPYTASSTLQQAHSGQSILILSNPPQLTNQYAAKANNEWITGTWGFAANATTTTNCAIASEYCNKAYVDSVAVAGASNADDSTKGIVEMATGLEAASSTSLGSTLARLAIGSNIATDTPNTATRGSKVLMSLIGGYLNQGWLDLTSASSWTFSGLVSIAASVTKPLTLNTVAYVFPSSQGAASSLLSNNGSGTLSWAPLVVPHYNGTTGGATANNGYATTTSPVVIPAGVLTASSSITFYAIVADTQGTTNSGTFYVRDAVTGATFASTPILDTTASGAYSGYITGVIYNIGSLSTQSGYIQNTMKNGTGTDFQGGVTNSTINTANAISLVGVMSSPAALNFIISGVVFTVNP